MMSEDDAIPEPAGGQNNTGSLLLVENGSERFRTILKTTFAVILAVLLMGHVALYSLHQALYSRVESQEHRIERLSKMLTDMLTANQNAEKIEKIEQQVTGIGGQMDDLTDAIKAQNAAAAAELEESPKNKKKGRR